MSMRRGGEISRKALTGLALCAGLTTAGCADFARVTKMAPSSVDSTSPIANQVLTAGRTDYPTPSFKDVPPKPADVRAVGDWRSDIGSSLAERERLTAWVQANPSYLTEDTETYAEGRRASIPASERGAQAPGAAGTDAFAERLRALAAPPPIPKY